MPLPLIGLVALLVLGAAELAVLVRVADAAGVLPTLLLLVGVGVLGMVLVRRQGLATLQRTRASMQAGRAPVAELFDGACILVAGVLLLLPGLLTDVAGCVLLLPPVRGLLYKALARRARTVAGRRQRPRGAGGPAVIEGEYERLEPLREGSSSSSDEERRRP